MERRTFDKFRALVYERSGITLGPQKEALVASRLGKRMRTLGIETFERYFEFVTNDATGQELVHLIDAISTNVTSFYREERHFELLTSLLSKWRDEGQRRIRIWSAASSTGEEPYTVAITVLEALRNSSVDVKILATDISTRVLQKCRDACYEENKVGTIPLAIRDRYFNVRKDGGEKMYVVKDAVKELIAFRRLNLSTPPFPMKGPFDVVFCRNVMIYFDQQIRSNLVNEIYRLLKPGGYLMVGHSESLSGSGTNFRSVQPSVFVK